MYMTAEQAIVYAINEGWHFSSCQILQGIVDSQVMPVIMEVRKLTDDDVKFS
jgi:hypothetical protein